MPEVYERVLAPAVFRPFAVDLARRVSAQFGVMFFPDKPGAFEEVRRVLRPEGTFVFNVWAALDGHDFESAVVAGLRRALPVDPPTFLEAVPHGYSDVDRVVADLHLAGFSGIEVDSTTLEGRSASAAEIAEGYCYGTPLPTEIDARGDLAAVTAVVAEAIEHRLGPGPITGSMTAHAVRALGGSTAF